MEPTTFVVALVLGIAIGLAMGLAIGRTRGVRENDECSVAIGVDRQWITVAAPQQRLVSGALGWHVAWCAGQSALIDVDHYISKPLN
jgi:hypothetical protein